MAMRRVGVVPGVNMESQRRSGKDGVGWAMFECGEWRLEYGGCGRCAMLCVRQMFVRCLGTSYLYPTRRMAAEQSDQIARYVL